MTTLLQDVETFLDRHNMSPTRLGDEALGDRHFVRQLRDGRWVRPPTEEKLRKFMAARDTAIVSQASCGKSAEISARQVPA